MIDWFRELTQHILAFDRRRADLAASVLLVVIIVGSMLAVGSVHPPVILTVGTLAFACVVFCTLGTRYRPARPSPLHVLLGLAAFTALQAVPLPIGLLATIAPLNADVWQRVLHATSEPGPTWATLSLDPGATRIETVKWLTYAGVFFVSASIASVRGAAWGSCVVFASTVIAAAITVAHGLAGATKVFGIYQPTFTPAAWHVGPLLNPNNLAGYLNLGVLIGIGLMLMKRPIWPRWMVGIGLAAIIGVEVTSASRGAAVSLLVGLVLLVVLLRHVGRTRIGDERTRLSRAGVALTTCSLIGGSIFAALGGNAEVWKDLYDFNNEKLDMLAWTRALIRDHAVLGIGRGAFEGVFPAYRNSPGNIVYTHPENFVAQWASEWGVVVGIGAIASLGWMLRPRRVGAQRSAVAACSWMAVFSLLLQNMLDLGMEVCAVSIAMWAVLGSLVGDGGRLGQREARVGEKRLSPGKIVVALTCGALALLVAAFAGNDLESDRAFIYAQSEKRESKTTPGRARLRGELRAAMLRHPAEPYFPLIGAMLAWQGKDESSIPWLQRSLERAAVNGRAHLLLAEVLAHAQARSQALMELRIAAEDDPAIVHSAAQMAVQWARTPAELVGIAPRGKVGAAFLDLAADWLQPDRVGDRVALLQGALVLDPDRANAHFKLATMQAESSRLGKTDARVCPQGSDVCRDSVEAHARVIESVEPLTSRANQLRASLLLARGAPEQAEELLARQCDGVIDRNDCLRARVGAAAQMTPATRLPTAVRDLLASGCSDPRSCASTSLWVGEVLARRGEWGGALNLFVRAAHDDPSESTLSLVADAAHAVGAHAQAAQALEKIGALKGGADPILKDRIQRERDEAMAKLIQVDLPR